MENLNAITTSILDYYYYLRSLKSVRPIRVFFTQEITLFAVTAAQGDFFVNLVQKIYRYAIKNYIRLTLNRYCEP